MVPTQVHKHGTVPFQPATEVVSLFLVQTSICRESPWLLDLWKSAAGDTGVDATTTNNEPSTNCA